MSLPLQVKLCQCQRRQPDNSTGFLRGDGPSQRSYLRDCRLRILGHQESIPRQRNQAEQILQIGVLDLNLFVDTLLYRQPLLLVAHRFWRQETQQHGVLRRHVLRAKPIGKWRLFAPRLNTIVTVNKRAWTAGQQDFRLIPGDGLTTDQPIG